MQLRPLETRLLAPSLTAHNFLHLGVAFFISLFDSPGSLVAPPGNLITCGRLFHSLVNQFLYFAIRRPRVEKYLGLRYVFPKNNFDLPSWIPSSPCAAGLQHVRQHAAENVRHFFGRSK